jgi:hypothetical protein
MTVSIDRAIKMKNFILGTLFGIVIATVGFSGVAKMLDGSVNKVKATVQEQVK